MRISISGQHLDVSDALRTHVEERLEKVVRHFDHLTDTRVVLQIERNRHKAEANLNARGVRIHAHAEAGDMYTAIDSMTDKLDRQVLRHKEKSRDHHLEARAKRPE